MTAPTGSQASTALGQYLTAAGGSFHPALHPRQDAYGTSIYTSEALEPGTSVVRCPFSIAITPTLVRTSIPTDLLPMPSSRVDPDHATDVDDDHVLMTLYLVLHLVNIHASEFLAASTREDRLRLAHEPYVAALPKPESLRTPLYFTASERGLLRGTNLEGATRDREQGWKSEWQAVQVRMKGAGIDGALVDEVSWVRWLWASTMISSRAFPSSLIDGDKAHSTPVLFPGVDLLNHRPTAKVTWSTDKPMSLEAAAAARSAGVQDVGGLSIVVDEPVSAGSQVYNTYGAKSNEELLLGYGFVLLDSSNQADILALKLSLPPSEVAPELPALLKQVGMEQLRHTVPPTGEIPSALLAQMRLLVACSSTPPPGTSPGQPIDDEEEEAGDDFAAVVERIRAAKHSEEAAAVLDFISWENELDVLDALGGMLEQKAQALMSVDLDVEAGCDDNEEIRSDVREMIRVYRSGQIAIVQAALAHRERLFEATVARAQEAGVDFAFEDEMNDDHDDDSDSE